MARITLTNTVNIAPPFVSTFNISPPSANTINYAGVVDQDVTNRYGDFKYGTTNQYGGSTETSGGQVMPPISTREV